MIPTFKTYAQFIEAYRRVMEPFSELAKHGFIIPTLSDDTQKHTYTVSMPKEMSPDALLIACSLIEGRRRTDFDELYLYQCVLQEGPKVFKPTTYQLFMMEETDLSLEIEEYSQPFPTVIIELPEDYYNARRAVLPQAGLDFCGEILPAQHDPRLMVMNYRADLRAVVSNLIFNSGISLKNCLNPKIGITIEEAIQSEGIRYKDSMEISEAEEKLGEDVLRACMNYMLLIEELGLKKLGPDNEKYFRRLNEFRDKANKRGDREQAKKHIETIKNLPIYYTIEQNVVLHKTVARDSELGEEGTGSKKRPHRRRGHWAHLPIGPRSVPLADREVRKVRRKPVFVNSHLFLGDVMDATTTYREKV